jgi:hypothetical protein
MRIAVLLYGRINRYKELCPRFFSFFAYHSIDIFYSCDAAPDEEFQEFIQLYRPKSWCNDKIVVQPLFEKYNYPAHCPLDATFCQFTNKQRVFALFETYVNATNTKYDLIFSTRLDVYYLHSLPEVLEIEENTIYVPNNHTLPEINDHIAYGTFNSMKLYMNILANCDMILTFYMRSINTHLLAFYNIIFSRLKLKLFSLNYHITTLSGDLKPKGWVTDNVLPLP